MRILFFSDIHADWNTLQRHMDTDADYYVAAGDLVSWAKNTDKAGQILSQRAEKVLVIPGNHESEHDIDLMCRRHKLTNLHGASLNLGGFHLAALGYSNPTPFNTPGEYTEEQLAARLQPFAALKPLVLVCHCPPKGTLLDRAAEGLHFGSTAILRFLQTEQPLYFLCGHIHEAEGVRTTIGITQAINVGKQGFLLKLEAAR
ncbi:MAG: metallophosphoesterase [Bryobacterales bacterium]|nr:metallophosphoesterase [Bryobacterales bacterium]